MTRRWTLAVATILACQPEGQTQPPAPAPAKPVVIDADSIRGHVAFLADDKQEGRAPGTDADTRVQKYVADAFAAAKLEPAFGDQWMQTFEITDGVRARAGQETLLDVSGIPIAHAMAPFSGESQAPVVARLVYVGYGIATEGKGTGDYAGLEKKVAGAIVVALAGGPDDPHLPHTSKRAATKVITARDHGAAGFVLWDPTATTFPNGGEAADLQVPAVFVGQAGSASLVTALVGKAKGADPTAAGLKRGDRSPKPGTLQTPIERVKLKTANVAGRVKGSGKSDRVIVVGAHMDHLGFGTDSSLAPGERAIHNGADDNASGVAAVIEICERAAATDAATRPFDLVCIAFGAEEMGLLGSKHYVQTLPEAERSKIAAMLNFDMVGRLGADGLVVAGAGTSKAWPALLESNRGELVVRTTDDGYGPSDHGSFYEAKIPVLHFFTGPHEDYHKPSDDLDKINYDGAATVANLASGLIAALQKDAIVPDYVEVARPAAPRGGGFNVSLGTIPDYGAKVDGVRMSGVRAGGAAAKAGVIKGDIITKLGAREVHNLDDYMAAFAETKAK
jgi:aminopeptidase YwaD